MASEVDICNMALTHLGDAGNVASIDPPEASTQARYCARYYPVARDEVLESHTWRFNTRRKALASVDLPAEVEDEWAYAYALPGDCLRPVAVYVPGVTDRGETEDFTIETAGDGSQILLTDVDGAHLKYLIRVSDASRFPPTVVAAIAARLAYRLALPITKSTDTRDGMLKLYMIERAHAAAVDASTQATEEWRNDERKPSWVSAR